MSPEELQHLIAAGENLAVEFKGEERAPLSDRELVETVVCLANRVGEEAGWLIVGVEDDGRITGTRPRHEHGQSSAYVRQRGFEPLQQEQMILQYVEKHDRITRKEAAELCRISLPQAYRLLDQLAESGKLAREGTRGRSVAYVKGSP
ncbi:MAG: RNA-binding domain-containing protein [Planctomycetota bacterium]|jgi:predicted HTH transcriptional regulator